MTSTFPVFASSAGAMPRRGAPACLSAILVPHAMQALRTSVAAQARSPG